MFMVLLAAMNSLGWFDTITTTTTAATMALAAAAAAPATHPINPEIINALMMESLRSSLVQACDGERITLHCPKNTQILIENVFYGRLVPSDQLCPSSSTKHQHHTVTEDTSCDVIQAHTKILEQCRNKRKCKILVKPSFFGSDPCADTSKYLQISYKCKPVSFDDETFCEGSTMHLRCKQNKRLAIYSARYGRTANGQAMHCTPNTPVSRDCVVDVLGMMLYDCHAQTECTVPVNDEHFGNARCAPGIHKYLSLIFMCMNDEIFSEAAVKGDLETMKKIMSQLPPRTLQKAEAAFVKDDERMFHVKDDPGHPGYKPARKSSFSGTNSNAGAHIPTNPRLAASYEEDDSAEEGAIVIAAPINPTPSSSNTFNAIGLIHDVMLIARTVKQNKEKALLCLVLSLLGGLTVLLIACTVSELCRRKRKRKKAASMQSNCNGLDCNGAAKSTELSTLMESGQSVSVFQGSESRICFDVGDLSNNKESFLRFTQLTPPRVPQNMHCYS